MLNVDLQVAWKIHIHGISEYFLSYLMRSSNPTTLLKSTCENSEDEKRAALRFWDPFSSPSRSSCYLLRLFKASADRCDFAIKRNEKYLEKDCVGGRVREGVEGSRNQTHVTSEKCFCVCHALTILLSSSDPLLRCQPFLWSFLRHRWQISTPGYRRKLKQPTSGPIL